MANRAWIWRGGSHWGLEEVPVPAPRQGEVRLTEFGPFYRGHGAASPAGVNVQAAHRLQTVVH